MVTNEERRKIADMLRRIADNHRKFDSIKFAPQAFTAAQTAMGTAQVTSVAEMLERYADLIEPAIDRKCTNVAASICVFMCSECGWFDKNRCDFNYCPNCGSKVAVE